MTERRFSYLTNIYIPFFFLFLMRLDRNKVLQQELSLHIMQNSFESYLQSYSYNSVCDIQ